MLKNFSRKLFCFSFIYIGIVTQSNAQIKLAKKILHKYLTNERDSSRKPTFMPLPIFSYAQETRTELGLMGLYSFYTDRNDSMNRISTLSASGSFTQNSQYTGKLRADIWTKNNDIHMVSEIRYRDFPFYYYGIGANTLKSDRTLLDEKRFRAFFSVDKKITGHYYIGGIIDFENYDYKAHDNNTEGIYPTQNLVGKNGGKILTLGVENMIDTRNTNTYTTKGQYINLGVNWAPNFFGKDNYRGILIDFDYRYFHSFTPKLVLGLNGNYSTLTRNNAPFYLLSTLGNDEIMRGYYNGRYRDKAFAAVQSELRYRFVPRFGVVAFAGMGTVYGQDKFSGGNIKPNYGGGFRYFFDLDKNMSVRIDYGVGQRVAGESRQGGFYFSFGESF